jgi:hypothetical protein
MAIPTSMIKDGANRRIALLTVVILAIKKARNSIAPDTIPNQFTGENSENVQIR